MISPKGYLVTGGAGFIGSHLVQYLLDRGDRVRVLDDFSSGDRKNLAPFLESDAADRLEVIEGTVADLETCRRCAEGMTGVSHQAALPSVPRSIEDPISSNHANVTGTLNLLIACRDAGVKRFVMASSSSVYGDTPELPKHEGMPTNPRSPYALTKYTGETYARMFFELYGLETVALRYFNVFGPRQAPDSPYAAVIPKFAFALAAGEQPVVHGDGGQTRDFTYVANAVEANIKSLESPDAPGYAINVATGVRVTTCSICWPRSTSCSAPRSSPATSSLAQVTFAIRWRIWAAHASSSATRGRSI